MSRLTRLMRQARIVRILRPRAASLDAKVKGAMATLTFANFTSAGCTQWQV